MMVAIIKESAKAVGIYIIWLYVTYNGSNMLENTQNGRKVFLLRTYESH
jgi:hypothetical protein